MDEHQTSRASVGGFFTIEPFPGLIMDPVSKEAYAVDDTVTTLFDTTGGRQMEMGPQGGIQNGLELKAGMAGPVPDEKIQGLLSRIRGKTKNTLLASRRACSPTWPRTQSRAGRSPSIWLYHPGDWSADM